MCSRIRCVLYFAFKFLWSNLRYILLLDLDCWHEWNTWLLFLLNKRQHYRLHVSDYFVPCGLTNIVIMKIGFFHELQITSKVSEAFVSYADTVGSPSKCKICSFFFFLIKNNWERIFQMSTCPTPHHHWRQISA